MGLLRNRGFLAAITTSTIVALYFVLVAGRAGAFLGTDDPIAKALGGTLVLLPARGVWGLAHEWRL